jgi:hypothetical protein
MQLDDLLKGHRSPLSFDGHSMRPR